MFLCFMLILLAFWKVIWCLRNSQTFYLLPWNFKRIKHEEETHLFPDKGCFQIDFYCAWGLLHSQFIQLPLRHLGLCFLYYFPSQHPPITTVPRTITFMENLSAEKKNGQILLSSQSALLALSLSFWSSSILLENSPRHLMQAAELGFVWTTAELTEMICEPQCLHMCGHAGPLWPGQWFFPHIC